MRRFGIDFAFEPHPTLAAMRQAGVTFVVRYLADGHGGSKEITAGEAKSLSRAGLDIVLVWERDAGRATKGGRVGAPDARAARAQAEAVGAPDNAVVYFAVDVDVPGERVAAYFQAAKNVLGVDRTGVYGSYRVVKFLLDKGLVRAAFQTYAWSGTPTQWDQRAQLQQYRNRMRVGGADVDFDRAMRADFGQWRTGRPNPPIPPDRNAAVHRRLVITNPHMRGADVNALQRATNYLSRSEHYALPAVEVDGDFGAQTLGVYKESGVRGVGYYLGLPDLQVGRGQPCREYLQERIRDPGKRTAIEKARGKVRFIRRRREIRRGDSGTLAADLLLRYNGHLETGDNTDRGGVIDEMQAEARIGHVSYCGAGVIWAYRHAAGIQLPLGWVYVPTIQVDARAGRSGTVVPLSKARRGDLVCWDWNGNGEGNHVGMFLSQQGRMVRDVAANTGGAGGEGIHVNSRSRDLVATVVRVKR